MDALLIKRPDVESRQRTKTGQDIHSEEIRLKAFDDREAKRSQRLADLERGYVIVPNKERPPLRAVKRNGRRRLIWPSRKVKAEIENSPNSWGATLICGEKGSGKSLLMATIAQRAWVEDGRKVFSNLGFLYGYTFTATDIYMSLLNLPDHGVLIVDEAHQPLSSIGSASHKILVFCQMLAGLRKRNQAVYLLSSQPDRIARSILDEMDWVINPRIQYPGKEKTLTHTGKYAHVRYPWCWLSAIRIGRHPYRSRTGATSQLLAAHRLTSNRNKVHKAAMTGLEPKRVYEASKGYDSFSPLLNPKDAGLGVKAADIKAGLEQGYYDWERIDFGEDPDNADHSDLYDETQRQILDAANHYDHTRYTAFLNALIVVMNDQHLHDGERTVSWAAEQATNIIEDPNSADHFWVTDILEARRRVTDPPAHNPLSFTTNETRDWLERFTGTRCARTFKITAFLQAVNANINAAAAAA